MKLDRINKEKMTSRYIIVKLLKTKEKEKFLKSSERDIIFKGTNKINSLTIEMRVENSRMNSSKR
jgi:hypothetical protein